MTRVAVDEGVLRWAMRRSGQDVADLEPKFPRIREWTTGESRPTLRQLELLAKATLTPLGFLFLSQPPDERLPIPHFRTIQDETPSKPSPDLIETVQMMQSRQAWMREFLIEQGQDRLQFVGSAEPNENPALVAERIRSALDLDAEWAADRRTWTEALRLLRETMGDSGILVVVNGIIGNNTHR